MKTKWNKEKCREVALLCETRTEFHKRYSRASELSLKNGWMNDICSHMKEMKKPNKYWTKEKCKEKSLLYTNKTDFKKNNSDAYFQSYKNGWLDEICSHMKIKYINKEYWTKERCHECALLCKSRTEFRKSFRNAYDISCKYKWNDEICNHMIEEEIKDRLIYSYEFSDNSVYIGLTHDIKDRHSRHMKDDRSAVRKHMIKTSYIPKLIIHTEYINFILSREKEEYYIEKYKKEGWNILNVAKSGSLGSNIIKWTKDKCKEVALLCNNRSDFWNKYPSAAKSANKNGWINDVCIHM